MSFAVLRSTEPDVAFAEESVHDPEAAERMAPLLLPDCERVGTATLGDAMYSDRLMIGVYGSAMMIGDPRLFEAEHADLPAVADQIGGLMPGARCVVGVMQNVCDRVWVRAVEGGRLLRELGAMGESGEVWADHGARREVESPFWSRDRWPELGDEEWEAIAAFPFTTEGFGDEVIGDLAFGAPLTRLPKHVYDLPVSIFDSEAAVAKRAEQEARMAAFTRRIRIEPLDLGAWGKR
jgi:hypothetical protein